MIQVKLFVGMEGHTTELEQEVNEWIRNSNAKVVNISGNMSPQSVLPGGEKGTTVSGGGLSRRFAPSDVLLIVTYEAD